MHPESLSRSISIYLERLRLKTAFKSRADRRDSRVIDERERKKRKKTVEIIKYSRLTCALKSRDFVRRKLLLEGREAKKQKKR